MHAPDRSLGGHRGQTQAFPASPGHVDDFGAVPACAQAVRDYLGSRQEVVDAQKIDWTGVYWRKP